MSQNCSLVSEYCPEGMMQPKAWTVQSDLNAKIQMPIHFTCSKMPIYVILFTTKLQVQVYCSTKLQVQVYWSLRLTKVTSTNLVATQTYQSYK